MSLSIVIPVFNKWNYTNACVSDLLMLPESTHEIIVVDNASTDETSERMQKWSPGRVRYIKNNVNLGFAKACNIGYGNASENVVMFLNNDIRVRSSVPTFQDWMPNPNWTDNILNNVKDNVLIGPTGGMIDIKNGFQFMYETNDPKKPINYMSGWCLSANKKTFDRLTINKYQGPFSEEFGLAYYEDTDLGFRATKLGMELKLVDIPVVHFGKISSSQINTHKLYTEARKIFVSKWSKEFSTK